MDVMVRIRMLIGSREVNRGDREVALPFHIKNTFAMAPKALFYGYQQGHELSVDLPARVYRLALSMSLRG